MKRSVHVWDRPSRLFHGALFLSVTGALVSAQFDDLLSWHFLFGEATLALLAFRALVTFAPGTAPSPT